MDRRTVMKQLMKEAAFWADEDNEKLPQDALLELRGEGDNPTQWTLTVEPAEEDGWENSPYLGGTFYVEIDIDPGSYPQVGPKDIKFVTRIYHPGVEEGSGKICTQFTEPPLWNPKTCNLLRVVQHVLALMKQPQEAEEPINPTAHSQCKNDLPGFLAKAKEFTTKYAQ